MNLSAAPTVDLAVELIARPDGPSEYGRLLIARRSYRKKLRPCPRCGEICGAAEMRLHAPKCPKNPKLKKEN